MPATTLLLIRHGHTDSSGGSREPRLTGVSDVELSELGRMQSQQLASYLRNRSERFDAICSSPLTRARGTARALVASRLGTLHTVDGLAEIDCGDYDGQTLSEVKAAIPDAWARNMRQDDSDFRWPGGESYSEFRVRCLTTLQIIAQTFTDSRVAVVTHAGVISQVMGSLLGVDAARWEPFRPGNTAVTELSWGESPRIVRFDDRKHLSDTAGRVLPRPREAAG